MKLSDMVDSVILKETSFQKAKGLMFTDDIAKENVAALFKFDKDKKIPIHMMFVFYPIDVLWVQSSGEIVDLKQKVMPFTPNVFHKGKAKYLVELPAGTIEKHKLKLMDKIDVNK